MIKEIIFIVTFSYMIICGIDLHAEVVGCPKLPQDVILKDKTKEGWLISFKSGVTFKSVHHKIKKPYKITNWSSSYYEIYKDKESIIECCHDIDGEAMICLSKKMEGMDCRNKFVKIGEFYFECDKIK